jgi:hypothetical protein
MSPVEIWGMPKRWQMNVAWVPLPAPGAPKRMSLIEFLRSLDLSGAAAGRTRPNEAERQAARVSRIENSTRFSSSS